MFRLVRRAILITMAGLAVSAPALAEFPEKPIKIIVPWNAGGVTDVLTRSIANAMTQIGGQPVIVDNRPGANGGIGAIAATRSAPDGYTLFVSNADTQAINPFIFKKLQYDPIKGFEPVSLFARVPFGLVAGPSKPEIKDVKTMISAARAQPRTVTFASWGLGSTSHLGMEIISRSIGVELHHVPFQGQAPGMLAVQGGHVDTMLLPAGGADAAAKGGSVRVLAVAADRRLDLMPTVPTLKELGVDVSTGNWFAFHAPAGTSSDIVRRLAGLTAKAMRDPKVLETFRVQASIPESSSPEQLRDFVASEQKRWSAVIKAANVVVE